MKISVVLNAHSNPKLITDTLESIHTWMSNDILMVVDGSSWKQLTQRHYNAYLLEGFPHNYHRSPYRNIIYGLADAAKKWPDADWYCYMEQDCLVGSNDFMKELEYANENGLWCLGADPRKLPINLPFFETILKSKIKNYNYLLGCCIFHKGTFIRSIVSQLERILYFTNDFTKGFFPDYEEQGGYDIAECLLPTMAEHFGGKVGGLVVWSEKAGKWVQGNGEKYPIRWRPDLPTENLYTSASILHPVKDYNHPIREFQRKKRKALC